MKFGFANRYRCVTIELFLLLTLVGACHAQPRFFLDRDFTAASFAETVNHFAAQGEDAAVRELRALASDSMIDVQRGLSVNVRIGLVCRVLFEAKNESLRPPRFGAPLLPYNTMPARDWPLFPVALSGVSYFVLSESYVLGGQAEDPKEYIDYCRQKGVFRRTPVVVPTKAQALADVSALRESAGWRAIKWDDSGQNWNYTFNERWVWEFVLKQAEDIR